MPGAGESRLGAAPWNHRGAFRADHHRDPGEPLHTGEAVREGLRDVALYIKHIKSDGFSPCYWVYLLFHTISMAILNIVMSTLTGGSPTKLRGFRDCYLDHPICSS